MFDAEPMRVRADVGDNGGELASGKRFRYANCRAMTIRYRRHLWISKDNDWRQVFARTERFHDRQRLTVFIQIYNYCIDVFQIASQDLPRATPRARAAHAMFCPGRGIDNVQVRLNITISYEKNVSFHASLLGARHFLRYAVLAKHCANLAALRSGSARGPRAVFGRWPKALQDANNTGRDQLPQKCSAKVVRRAAERSTPAACAPQTLSDVAQKMSSVWQAMRSLAVEVGHAALWRERKCSATYQRELGKQPRHEVNLHF